MGMIAPGAEEAQAVALCVLGWKWVEYIELSYAVVWSCEGGEGSSACWADWSCGREDGGLVRRGEIASWRCHLLDWPKKESPIKFHGLGPEGFGFKISPAEKIRFNQKADEGVLAMFPRLKDQPKLCFTPDGVDPLRLYHFIVPSDCAFARSIAWVGAVSTVSTATCATIQGHWTAAYLTNALDHLPNSNGAVVEDIVLHTQWGKWRCPCGYGTSLPDFVFEGLPYIDMLLRDLGLENNRKKSWFAELTEPYMSRDFAGLVEEWKTDHVGSYLKLWSF
jgi:hypothetical protein